MSARALGNQPAHPFAQTSETFQHTSTQHAGLTKREVFAKAALQGLCANPHPALVALSESDLAASAVEHADALLAQLAKDGAE